MNEVASLSDGTIHPFSPKEKKEEIFSIRLAKPASLCNLKGPLFIPRL
jgi:hypothetical protein